MSKLKIIEKVSELEELIHYCKQTKVASIDFETTSLKYYSQQDYPLILGVSFQPGSSWIIPLGHKDSCFKKNYRKIFTMFAREVLEDWDIVKVAWNLKFEYKWALSLDCRMKGRLFDAMLAKYCLDEERPHDLKSFAAVMFPKYANYEDQVKDRLPWAEKDFLKLSTYCGIDCDVTNRGMIYMEPKLIKLGFYNLFRNMLMMATRVLAESEYRGIRVDRQYLEGLMKQYEVKINDSQNKLDNNPNVLKYERKYKKYHIKKLIERIQLEIEALNDDDTKDNSRMISNRQAKITNISNGILTGKKEIYEGMNFASPPQMGEFLFKSKFGLRLKPTKYTDSGAPSTDEESLKELKKFDKTGFMDSLLDHRGLVKLDSTYISGINPLLDVNDRVHAGFKIHGTVTGRLSCSDPNLQNIPRDTTASDIKKMFIPPPGYVLLEVDYGQAELRIIAERAKDKVMIDIFKRGYNIHVATACKINGALDRYEEIKKIIKVGDNMSGEELAKPKNKEILFWLKQKKRGKTINFAIVYGQTEKKLAIELECSEADAKQVIADWFNAYKGVKRWMKEMKKFVHANGYVMSMFGRKRRLYNIDSPKFYMMLEAERQAINAPIQGDSSDFGQLSTIVIRDMILRGQLPVDMQQVYSVHDSIGYYIRPKDIHGVVPIVTKVCANPDTLKYFGFELKHVSMKISPEVGIKSWGDLNEYQANADYTKLWKERGKDN